MLFELEIRSERERDWLTNWFDLTLCTWKYTTVNPRIFTHRIAVCILDTYLHSCQDAHESKRNSKRGVHFVTGGVQWNQTTSFLLFPSWSSSSQMTIVIDMATGFHFRARTANERGWLDGLGQVTIQYLPPNEQNLLTMTPAATRRRRNLCSLNRFFSI